MTEFIYSNKIYQYTKIFYPEKEQNYLYFYSIGLLLFYINFYV